MIRPGRARVAVVTLLVVTAGVAFASGCGRATDALDTDDRNRFVDAANGFLDAVDAFDADVSALVAGDIDRAQFSDAADASITAMEDQAEELSSLAGNVDGAASDIAASAATAATDVVESSRDAVVAIEAIDEAALADATRQIETAIDAFNEQVRAWNEL